MHRTRIKALLNFEGKKLITGHNIKELFEQLSDDTKEKIKAELSEERFKAYLDSYLEENKNDSIDWRYNYEEACSASTDFLKDFSTAVIKVGESLDYD